jgi:hypothetical protein
MKVDISNNTFKNILTTIGNGGAIYIETTQNNTNFFLFGAKSVFENITTESGVGNILFVASYNFKNIIDTTHFGLVSFKRGDNLDFFGLDKSKSVFLLIYILLNVFLVLESYSFVHR